MLPPWPDLVAQHHKHLQTGQPHWRSRVMKQAYIPVGFHQARHGRVTVARTDYSCSRRCSVFHRLHHDATFQQQQPRCSSQSLLCWIAVDCTGAQALRLSRIIAALYSMVSLVQPFAKPKSCGKRFPKECLL